MSFRKITKQTKGSISKRLAVIVAAVLLGVFAVMTVCIIVFVGGKMLTATDKTMYAMADNAASKVQALLNVSDDIDENIQTVIKRMYESEDNDSGIKASWTVEGQ